MMRVCVLTGSKGSSEKGGDELREGHSTQD